MEFTKTTPWAPGEEGFGRNSGGVMQEFGSRMQEFRREHGNLSTYLSGQSCEDKANITCIIGSKE